MGFFQTHICATVGHSERLARDALQSNGLLCFIPMFRPKICYCGSIEIVYQPSGAEYENGYLLQTPLMIPSYTLHLRVVHSNGQGRLGIYKNLTTRTRKSIVANTLMLASFAVHGNRLLLGQRGAF